MEAAIFGLVGTLLGGVITIVVAYLNGQKDLTLKRLEFDVQRNESERAERAAQRERRLERYAAFLGAYRQVQGSVVDIVLLMQDRPEGWSTTIGEIVDSPEFCTAIGRLNDGAAWVALLCRETRAAELASRLSGAHDSLFEELRRAKTAAVSGEAIDAGKIASRRNEADSCFEELLGILRREMSVA